MDPKEKLTRQYHAELFDENGTVTIRSSNVGEVKHKISNLTESPAGEAYFEALNARTQVVYDRKGGVVIGWISEFEVPESANPENRLGMQKAAA